MTSKFCSNKWVLILSLLAATCAASPVAMAANTVENFRLKGKTLLALFEAFDPDDDCLLNIVFVFASDLVEKTSPDGQKSLRAATTLTIIQRDVCSDTLLFSATGSAANQTFQVAGNLSSATLTAEVVIVDEFAGAETFVVNLTWTATVSAEFLHFKETFQDPELGIRLMSQSVGFIAQATATGTVFGLGANLTPETSDTASIQSQNDGSLLIQKTF